MNLQDELNKILKSILGKVEFNHVSSLLLNHTYLKRLTDRFRNSLRSNVDIIMTFAETKITDKKYLELLLALGNSCIVHGENDIAKEILDKLLLLSKKGDGFLSITGHANLQIAIIESNQANWVATQKSLRNAIKIFHELSDEIGLAECENLLGTVEAEKGKLKLAEIHFRNAYSYVKYKRKNLLKSKIEINLGIICNMLEKYEEAEIFYHKALIVFTEVKEQKRIAETTHNLGMLYLKVAKYKQAIKEFEKSIKISEVENYNYIMGITFLGLAETYLLLGDIENATLNADRGFEMCNKTNDRLTIADIYKVRGIICKKDKKYESAENYLLTCLRINKELKNELNTAEVNYELGLLFEETKDSFKAVKHFKLALVYYREYNCQKEIQKIRIHLSK